jgi:hypothetical protein
MFGELKNSDVGLLVAAFQTSMHCRIKFTKNTF